MSGIKKIFWIDSTNNHQDIEKIFSTNHQRNLEFFPFQNLKSTFDEIAKINFEIIFIVLKENLYQDYFSILNKVKSRLTCFPISIIYISDNSINLNLKNCCGFTGTITSREKLITFIRDFNKSINQKIQLNPKNGVTIDYNNTLTFEKIKSHDDLIIPSLYALLKNIEGKENIINNEDIYKFNNILVNNHFNNNISELIIPLNDVQNIPLEIVTKFWIKYYTSESSFYPYMNAQLMKNKPKNYEIFVRAMYKGIENKYLQSEYNIRLYRCQLISKEEMGILEKNLILVYSRTFLSFSKDKNRAINFLKKGDNYLVPVMFIVNTINLEEVFSSNAEVEQYSFYPNEKEVLFFPFSSFIVDEIIDTQLINGIEVKIVNLNYLGKYREEIENKINTLDENKIKELLSKDSKFVKDISSIQLNEDKIKKNQIELKEDIQKAVNKVKEKILIKKMNSSNIKIINSDINNFIIKVGFHPHQLLYLNSKSNIFKCYLCNENISDDNLFHCNLCKIDICLLCLLENNEEDNNPNNNIYKIYETLKKNKTQIIKYDTNNLVIKTFYHIHELAYTFSSDNSEYICDSCEKKYYNSISFNCIECDFDVCLECLYDELNKKEKLTKIHESLFKIKLDRLIYGFLFKFKLYPKEAFILFVYEKFENIMIYLTKNKKKDIEVYFNNEIKYISLDEIENNWEFNELGFCWLHLSEKEKNNKIPLINALEIDEYNYTNDFNSNKYKNKLVFNLSFNNIKINQIESNIGIINNKNPGLPIVLLNNLKIIGINNFENNNKVFVVYFNSYIRLFVKKAELYYIFCILNLKPKYTNDLKKINQLVKKFPNHNENIYAVEAYNDKIHASIEIIGFKKNGNFYILKKRKKIDQCELAFQKYRFAPFFIIEEVKINNKIEKIAFPMSKCPDNICPKIKEKTIISLTDKIKVRTLETKIITPLGSWIEAELVKE